jgi:hypothetical protein
MINQKLIEQLAKEAGMVQGPWANGNKERIWQENREFPDALEVFANLIANECVKIIDAEIEGQTKLGIHSTSSLSQAKAVILEKFSKEKLYS